MSQSKGAHNALEDAKYKAELVMNVLSAISNEFDNGGFHRD